MPYRCWLILLLCAALPARGEAKVRYERNQKDAENVDFRFKEIPPLSDTDPAQDAAIEVIDGKAAWGSEARQLIDGIGQSAPFDAARAFRFGQGTSGGRIRLDFGAVRPISQVNTYSWNGGDRGPQVYTLYGSDGAPEQFTPSPLRGTDPTRVGWVKIAAVDTRPTGFMKTDGGGGQYGVSITDEAGPEKAALGNYRYLLWDISAARAEQATFYSEFDVLIANTTGPTRLARLETGSRAIEGIAAFDGDAIVLTADDRQQRFALTDIARVVFRDLPTAAAPPAIDAPSAGGLKGEYFDDQELKKPRLVRYDPVVDFNWGLGPPDPTVNSDFSARWTGQIEPKYGETFSFETRAGDGVRLWIDGKAVIDQWYDRPPFEHKGTIALKGSHKYDIKIEYHNKMSEAFMQLRWSSPSQPRQIVPASRLSPPASDPDARPRVTLVSPKPERWKIAPGSLELEAKADSPKGSLSRVEFYAGTTLLGTATTQPYRATWARVPPGHHKITARATDDSGIAAASSPVIIDVGANGSGTLPPPWGSLRLGALDRSDSSAYVGGVFTVRSAGGEIRGAFDSAYFLAQPLDGDGQITARVGDINCENAPSAVAGLMIREALSGDSRYAAVLAGKEGVEFLRRWDPGSWVAASDISRTVPCYLRLVRAGKNFKAYVSDNGTSWQLIGSEQVPLGTQAFVGLVATSRSDDAGSTATIDHVQVVSGPPPMEAAASGIKVRGGSFLAGEIRKADDKQIVLVRKRGSELTFSASEVSRILLHPVPRELAAGFAGGKPGMLLASGDFIEGEFRGFKDWHVLLDSVVFGPQSVEADKVLAVVLHDGVDDPKKPRVWTMDGSLYAPKSIKLEAGRLWIDDESIGAFSVSLRDVVEIKR